MFVVIRIFLGLFFLDNMEQKSILLFIWKGKHAYF